MSRPRCQREHGSRFLRPVNLHRATRPAGASARKRIGGFSLVEIMVVIGIISLLVALAVPAALKIRRRSQATATANDLRVFAAAFDGYAQERGAWPAEADAGVMPPEMVDRIKDAAWNRLTPIGGRYNWDFNQMHYGTRYKAVIQISSTTDASLIQDVDLWEALDRAIDDGDLMAGNFRLGTDDEPIFIIAP
jgi:prepilin-type N-terminal cleavage/methylation domain-containing protein